MRERERSSMMGAVLWSSEGGRRKFFFSLVATGVTPSYWPRGPWIVWSSQRNAGAKTYRRIHLPERRRRKKNGIESFLGARVLFPVGSAFPVFENLKKTRQVMDFYMYFESFLETCFSRLNLTWFCSCPFRVDKICQRQLSSRRQTTRSHFGVN